MPKYSSTLQALHDGIENNDLSLIKKFWKAHPYCNDCCCYELKYALEFSKDSFMPLYFLRLYKKVVNICECFFATDDLIEILNKNKQLTDKDKTAIIEYIKKYQISVDFEEDPKSASYCFLTKRQRKNLKEY